MKKLITESRWKRHIACRQRASLRRTRSGPQITPLQRRTPPPHRRTAIRVPAVFSLVEAPEQATEFFSAFGRVAGRYRIDLDLSAVRSLTSDAVAALVAAVRSVQGVSGNVPGNPGAREMLIESDFFRYVRARQAPPAPTQGRLQPKRSQRVEPELARDLIELGKQAVNANSGKRPHAYRALIECMSNTHNHASSAEMVRETWWCSVYGDRPRGRICFTFLDTGVGIFKSVKVRRWKRFFGGNETVLRGILNRRIASSTGDPFRGKGLPAIYDSLRSGGLKSLVIIANDVHADLAKDEYRNLRHPFRGTLLYWETA